MNRPLSPNTEQTCDFCGRQATWAHGPSPSVFTCDRCYHDDHE